MRWLENNAQLSARAYLAGAPVRCSGLHGLTFLKPADCHVFVHLRSGVVHATDEELTVLVSVEAEQPAEGHVYETLRAFLTYVPAAPGVKVPRLECQSDAERELYHEVEHRLALQRSLPVPSER
jgi:acyl-CoA hydrolase